VQSVGVELRPGKPKGLVATEIAAIDIDGSDTSAG
jgi:hypothetical protein